jgi:hypothetical protein
MEPAQEVKVETRAARLQELEETAAAMSVTACKLPPCQERDDILEELENIRAQINSLKAKRNA